MPLTYGDLRKLIIKENLGWQPRADRPDYVRLPRYSLGGSTTGLVPTANAPKLDLKKLGVSGNPRLAIRRAERGLTSIAALKQVYSTPILRRFGLDEAIERNTITLPPDGGSAAGLVDWRNRWGRNWITSIRDQNHCQACWAFAGTALVEAMVRIEHTTWTRLSEGDVHRGVGKTCPDGGNLGEVSEFFAKHGICDPGSWPWSTVSSDYAPTPDRNGRSVRGPAFDIVSVADSKNWLDTVGPLVTWLEVYNDFSAVSGTVYRRSRDPSNAARGGHFMLIIGYNDALGAWLCKNSWGTLWGMNGVGWIGYGETSIDDFARYGLRNTNPDPWTKRRLHNGNLYESGNGALHRNLEVVGTNGSRVQHRFREGNAPWTWGAAATFGNDAAVCPTLIGSTHNRNLEVIYTTTGGRLRHWWTGGGGSGPWNDAGVFGPTGCTGVPGFIQSDYNAPGNFEVVVSVAGNALQHVWLDGAGWHDGAVFGSSIATSGATLVQSSEGTPHGNLQCVAVRTDGTMQHFVRNDTTNYAWFAGWTFGAGVSSAPVMIQGQHGMTDELSTNGSFELCVAVNGRVQHWWRWSHGGPEIEFQHIAEFGHDVAAVTGLCEGSWGMNLELIVLRTDNQLQHYHRDGAGWHEGVVIGPA
jgi:Papain family cysteine protease